ncbi:MAG: protein kinase, partial [Planctomycetales bacterium]|nr:protein kinase [Planctomycetales bacterium]
RAAALIQHPNMVTVYDVGEFHGQPYFSMQLVEGTNCAELLRESPFEPETAARYLRDVANAVGEAHRNGVLHRDLKPHNIMIEAKSDSPKVGDFGLAKFMTRSDAATSVGQILGTPQYMAPEQAQDASLVQPVSDVYSLGASLYHFLTGRPPFQAATGAETIRQLLDSQPVAPRELSRSIPLDLETICLKCLEKEPGRRYQSAQALADDLDRFLQGKPILARPLGPVSHAVRWCRRNPGLSAATALALVCIVSLFVVLAAANRRDRAALANVAQAQEEANASFRQAREAVDTLLTHASENVLLNQPGLQPLRQELLADALAYYEQFAARDGVPLVEDELGLLHYRLGRITADIDSPEKAVGHFERALAIQRQLNAADGRSETRGEALGDTLNFYGQALARLDRLDEAEAAFSEAIQVRERLNRVVKETVESRRKLANVHMNHGQVLAQKNQRNQAQEEFGMAQQMRAAILKDDPTNTLVMSDRAKGFYNSANLALKMGDTNAARTDFDKAVGLFREVLVRRPEWLDNQYRLALCYRRLGDMAEGDAEQQQLLYTQAADLLQLLSRLNPHVPMYHAALAGIHLGRAAMYQSQEDFTNATRELHDAEVIYRMLTACDPVSAVYRRDLAATRLAQGILLRNIDAPRTAREALLDAQHILEALINDVGAKPPDCVPLSMAVRKHLAALNNPADDVPAAAGTFPGPPEP